MGLTLRELVDWFMDRADVPPRAMHRRGIWTDQGDSAGSAIGSPAWTNEWSRWLYAPPDAKMVEEYEDVCLHPGVPKGATCSSCTVVTEEGQVLYSTGRVKRRRLRYRWPMRLVIHRLWRAPARPDRPNLGSMLWHLMLADGDVLIAADALATRWPVLRDPTFAHAYMRHALRRAQRLYRLEVELARPPGGKKPKSDAQLDAEAQRRVASVR